MSDNNIPKTKIVNILGKDIRVKNYICSRDGGEYREKTGPLQLQLSIIPTEICGCNCSFCAAKDSMHGNTLDTGKLEDVLRKLKEADIVRGISITGGEPFTDIVLLDEIVTMCFELFGDMLEMSINTNGSGLSQMHKIKRLKDIDTIHISRHHYDDAVNAALFAGKVPTNSELKEIVNSVSFKDIFVFNCILMKDFIGTRDEFHKFMDFNIEMGVPKTGFITAMEVNDFTRSQRVSYEDIISRDDQRLLFTRCYRDYDICRCQDGVYTSPNGGIAEFYGRQTLFGTYDYVKGFVYGADNHLRTGYTGDVII
ncbi:radical SAM protein [Butyrivibrio sp. VCB2006]|uniref:radical SAM protein n=1 Tax=Butyrivibrio sp. VCB2006 TaxID=1280679 RepID=UPI000492BB17|nr:radical SAM protein [Butyrivibrio sp. VCB2006]